MKKITFLVASLMMGLSAVAQTGDPVVMKINGKNITRSEFEYSFNKNNSDGVLDKKTVEEYVPLFVDFKLKVAEAESQRIDTLSTIRKELMATRSKWCFLPLWTMTTLSVRLEGRMTRRRLVLRGRTFLRQVTFWC